MSIKTYISIYITFLYLLINTLETTSFLYVDDTNWDKKICFYENGYLISDICKYESNEIILSPQKCWVFKLFNYCNISLTQPTTPHLSIKILITWSIFGLLNNLALIR